LLIAKFAVLGVSVIDLLLMWHFITILLSDVALAITVMLGFGNITDW
jgi:hypothetical protein